MQTATTREVQHGLGRVLERVRRGETINVTKHGRVVAKLVPPDPAPKAVKPVWPDFAARLRERFPDGPLPGKPVSEILAEQRAERH